METNFTASVLKANNKKNIIDYIYNNKEVTPQEISEDLNLSRPTVANNLKECLQENIICQKGNAESTGGRKAKRYVFNNLGRIAIGLEILSDRYEIVAVDLYLEMLKFEKVMYPFSNTESYFEHVCNSVNQFIESLQAMNENILGVGIALQGLISSDGEKVIYGKILNCTFNHDAESVANEELWLDSKLDNAVFFNIRDNLSGAIIIHGKFFRGGDLKSGIFEHMTLIPNGRSCYCGKKGCVNTYCSINALLKPEENIEFFFNKLRNNNPEIKKRWLSYLEYLSITIDNLHMFINSDVILGGTLSKYLKNEDILLLQKMIRSRSAFPASEYRIKISKSSNLPICIGAAIPFIKKYLKEL